MIDRWFLVRWAVVIFLAQLLVSGCTTSRNRQYSGASASVAASAAKPQGQTTKKALVTGSMIPQPVDEQGRPTKSTVSVVVVDEKTINLVGAGSVAETLNRLPYVRAVTR